MCLCAGGVWGGGSESVAALSLWLSKLCACRGWLAGRLRNTGRAGFTAGGGGRLFSQLRGKPMLVFIY